MHHESTPESTFAVLTDSGLARSHRTVRRFLGLVRQRLTADCDLRSRRLIHQFAAGFIDAQHHEWVDAAFGTGYAVENGALRDAVGAHLEEMRRSSKEDLPGAPTLFAWSTTGFLAAVERLCVTERLWVERRGASMLAAYEAEARRGGRWPEAVVAAENDVGTLEIALADAREPVDQTI